MKLNISFNFWIVIWFALIIIGLVFVSIQTIKLIEIQNEYNLKMQELTQANVEWLYLCDSSWQSAWYNCGSQLRNMTGYYCEGKMICQNEWVRK